MSLVNSIVRGFGSQIGRTAAVSMINSVSNDSDNVVIRTSNALSFWQVVKTFLWSILMLILAVTLAAIFSGGNVHSNKFMYITIGIWSFATFCIGRDYYKANKKQNDYYDAYNEALIKRNEAIAKLHQTIEETDTAYIDGKITKREYEVLMRRTNKLLKEYTK
jgi:uncharacterized membrane protein